MFFGCFCKHFLDSSLKLFVFALEDGCRVIVNQNVRLYLMVLAVMSFLETPRADLRDTEDYLRVDLVLPPYGGHGSRYWSADNLTDAECLISVWESTCVRVVVFASEDA